MQSVTEREREKALKQDRQHIQIILQACCFCLLPTLCITSMKRFFFIIMWTGECILLNGMNTTHIFLHAHCSASKGGPNDDCIAKFE